MSILLLADHSGKDLSEATAKTLTAAQKINKNIDILVAGSNIEKAASCAAKLSGVQKVLIANSISLKNHLSDSLANLIFSISKDYDIFISPATSVGKDVMPRLAGLLNVAQISEIISVINSNTFQRSIYSGNVIQTIQSLEKKKVITVRTSEFFSANLNGNAKIQKIYVPCYMNLSRFILQKNFSKNKDLSSARIVVAGGRSLNSAKNFREILYPLAECLGAAIGASRAAVDAGYISSNHQIGQSGKIISPKIYIAIGISGSLQHLNGIKKSKTILAINKDPEAPIFKISDYGIIGDLFKIVPDLTKGISYGNRSKS